MHPTIESLTDYLESPELPTFSEVRQHLVLCSQCRSEVTRLMQVRQHIINDVPYFSQHTFNYEPLLQQLTADDAIEAYVDGKLGSKDKETVHELLQNNKNALKAALHYANHSASMQKYTTNNAEIGKVSSNASAKVVRRHRFFDFLRQHLKQRPDTWVSIPVTAAVVFILSIVLLPQLQNYHQLPQSIASYQDEKMIQFNKSDSELPGIGFFSGAKSSQQLYDGVNIALTRDRNLIIQWKPVKQATTYAFTIYKTTPTGKSTIASTNTTTNSAKVSASDLQSAQHYLWELSGKTVDKRNFSVTGGFVIND